MIQHKIIIGIKIILSYSMNYFMWIIIIQSDINECGEVNDCQQTCMNTEGSYSCSCDVGFSLADDGRTCTGNIIIGMVMQVRPVFAH